LIWSKPGASGGGTRHEGLQLGVQVQVVLGVRGDGPGALAAYRQSLEIREALAARDPANTQWQTDVAVSCAKLGTLETEAITYSKRKDYLLRGSRILSELKSRGQLMPNQDWTDWFDARIAELLSNDS